MEEHEAVEQKQLDTGTDTGIGGSGAGMGVGVGARRTGMEADMGRDHGSRGMGASTGMDKMSMSKMSCDISHVCAPLESSQLRVPGDEHAKEGPRKPPHHRVGGCSTDVCPAGHTLWGEHVRERHASSLSSPKKHRG